MNPREEEYLTHIAAGTDPLTALAATPGDEPEPEASGFSAAIALAVLLAVIVYLLFSA